MTSHLSLSCSVRACSHPSWRFATAASSALVGLVREEVGRPLQPPLHAMTVYGFFLFVVVCLPFWQSGERSWVWGTEFGPPWHYLCSVGLWELGLAEKMGGSWESAGQCAVEFPWPCFAIGPG